eukprot:5457785-Karenia_brevis.AAC.1
MVYATKLATLLHTHKLSVEEQRSKESDKKDEERKKSEEQSKHFLNHLSHLILMLPCVSFYGKLRFDAIPFARV